MFFIYCTTFQKNRIWTEYLASPDLEQSLTEIKKGITAGTHCGQVASFVSNGKEILIKSVGRIVNPYRWVLLFLLSPILDKVSKDVFVGMKVLT